MQFTPNLLHDIRQAPTLLFPLLVLQLCIEDTSLYVLWVYIY